MYFLVSSHGLRRGQSLTPQLLVVLRLRNTSQVRPCLWCYCVASADLSSSLVIKTFRPSRWLSGITVRETLSVE